MSNTQGILRQFRFWLSVLGIMAMILMAITLYASPGYNQTYVVMYDEPSTNADGTPLADLDRVEVYYDIGAGPVLGATVPASSPQGGVLGVQTTIVVPIPPDAETTVTVHARAFDTTGNQSDKSNEPTDLKDTLDPGVTTNVQATPQ